MTIDFTLLQNHRDQLEPGTAEVELLRQEAKFFIQQIDRKENLRTEKVYPLKAGMWNALFRLEPAGLVLKLSANNNDFEVNFLRMAFAQDVPVPQVTGAGAFEHPRLMEASYFLMTYIPEAINPTELIFAEKDFDRAIMKEWAAIIGRSLAELHRVHLGYVARFSRPAKTWKECLTDGFSPDWDTIPGNDLFQGELLEAFRLIIRTSLYFEFSDGCLGHYDLNLNNVLVDAKTHRLKAILDPAGFAGMPMFDLAYATMPWEYSFDYLETMVEAYQKEGGIFDPGFFYISLIVVAYRHIRFHTPAIRQSLLEEIIPRIILTEN